MGREVSKGKWLIPKGTQQLHGAAIRCRLYFTFLNYLLSAAAYRVPHQSQFSSRHESVTRV